MIKDYLKCPICGNKLGKNIQIGSRDELIVLCDSCGKYGISREYYDDRIEPKSSTEYRGGVFNFLKGHKPDELRPFLSVAPVKVPEGFKNYLWFVAQARGN